MQLSSCCVLSSQAYLVIRTKKGESQQQRLKTLLSGPVFRLHHGTDSFHQASQPYMTYMPCSGSHRRWRQRGSLSCMHACMHSAVAWSLVKIAVRCDLCFANNVMCRLVSMPRLCLMLSLLLLLCSGRTSHDHQMSSQNFLTAADHGEGGGDPWGSGATPMRY